MLNKKLKTQNLTNKIVNMDSEKNLNRIKYLPKGKKIQVPEKIYYSGSNYSEEAIYYEDKNVYKD